MNKQFLLPIYIVLFFTIWTFYEFLVKPQVILNASPLIGTLLQSFIKLLIWTLPSFYFIKNDSTLVIPYPDIFTNKFNHYKFVVLAFAFIIFLLAGSYIQYGNLEIRKSFHLIDLINSVLFVGITEELVFRGWILNSLLTKMKTQAAVILSSVLFLIIHFPVWIYTGVFTANILSLSFIQVFVLGVIFSITLLKSRNILIPIFLHMIWNLFTIMFYS